MSNQQSQGRMVIQTQQPRTQQQSVFGNANSAVAKWHTPQQTNGNFVYNFYFSSLKCSTFQIIPLTVLKTGQFQAYQRSMIILKLR